MEESWLRVAVPHPLRVRRMMNVGGATSNQVSVVSMFLVLGFVAMWLLSVLNGADEFKTAIRLGFPLGAGLLFLEGNWHGRSTWATFKVKWRFFRHPKSFRLYPLTIMLSQEPLLGGSFRRPIWDQGASARPAIEEERQ